MECPNCSGSKIEPKLKTSTFKHINPFSVPCERCKGTGQIGDDSPFEVKRERFHALVEYNSSRIRNT